jgi:ElaB/YqjD/DUF883 family membrane-anchored ribosome-binding protein
MSKSVAKKIARNVDDALDDLLAELKKAGDRLGDEAEDGLSRAAARLSEAAHALAIEARNQSKAVATGAVREVKAHPMAAASIIAAAAALVGLVIACRPEKTV